MPRQFAHVSRIYNMEWDFKENRMAVIALHTCGTSDYQIFKLLKQLKISRNFVCRAVKRYKELWGVEDWAPSVTSEKCGGWSRYQNSMGADSPKSALETENHVPRAEHIDPLKPCLIRDDLQRADLPSKGHLPTLGLKEIRRTRAERLFHWNAENGHGREICHHRGAV